MCAVSSRDILHQYKNQSDQFNVEWSWLKGHHYWDACQTANQLK